MTTTRFEVPSEWGYQWPLSVLAGATVEVTEAPNGDLVDLSVTRDGREVDTTDLEAAELAGAQETYETKEES